MAKDKKLFKRTFFGYGADGVYAYLKELNDKLARELHVKDAEIARLTAENARLTEQQNAQPPSPPTAQTDEERAPIIIDAIISNAQQEAERIITTARQTSLAKQKEIQEAVRHEKTKLRILQAEISGLQRMATNALEKFSGDLSNLIEE